MQIENAYALLFRSMQFKDEQMRQTARFWEQWVAMRRNLDTSASAAIASLSKLPSPAMLPAAFLLHVAKLACAERIEVRMHAQTPLLEMAPRSDSLSSNTHDTVSCVRALAGEYDGQSGAAQASGSWLLSESSAACTGSLSESAAHDAPRGLVAVSRFARATLSHHGLGTLRSFAEERSMREGGSKSAESDKGDGPPLLLMGQSATAMREADKAVQELMRVSSVERDLWMDQKNMHIPGITLTFDQMLVSWSEYALTQVVPPDFLASCQLAANHLKRRELFSGV
jgi:hypothetical protein